MDKAEFEQKVQFSNATATGTTSDPVIEPIAAPGKADLPSEDDKLDRSRYVSALAALISHERTQVPLTIGVYGEWGSGKSSFMKQVENMLLRRRHTVVKFNAWKFTGAGELWIELVRAVASALDKQLPFLQRLRFLIFSGYAKDVRTGFSKLWKRFLASLKKLENWIAAPILAGVSINQLTDVDIISRFLSNVYVQKIVSILADAFGTNTLKVVGVLIILLSAAVILIKITRTVFRPFSTQFEVYLDSLKKSPEDKHRLTQSDLASISSMYAAAAKKGVKTKPPIVVFLDDLDRCPPDKIVEILEAVNLFFEGLPFVTVFGLSPRVVCRAVANEYSFLLQKDATQEEQEEFGRSFLQKIIHIPFQLPPAENLESYITSLIITKQEQEKTTQEVNTVLYGKEALAQFKGVKKYLNLFSILYVDFSTWLLLRKNATTDELQQLSVINRIFHGLSLLPYQLEWIQQQPPNLRFYYDRLLELVSNEPINFSNLFSYLKKFKIISNEALQVEMELESNDITILQDFSRYLLGNPRTIKRFVNVYQFAKGINAQLPPEQRIPLQNLAAWLALQQNWPKEGARLHKTAKENPNLFVQSLDNSKIDPKASPAYKNYLDKFNIELQNLVDHTIGREIAGCFSFVSATD